MFVEVSKHGRSQSLNHSPPPLTATVTQTGWPGGLDILVYKGQVWGPKLKTGSEKNVSCN